MKNKVKRNKVKLLGIIMAAFVMFTMASCDLTDEIYLMSGTYTASGPIPMSINFTGAGLAGTFTMEIAGIPTSGGTFTSKGKELKLKFAIDVLPGEIHGLDGTWTIINSSTLRDPNKYNWKKE